MEALDEFENIKQILISTEILGEYQFEEFIDKILEKNENLEITVFSNSIEKMNLNFLNSKKIYNVYENNEYGYNEYLKKINNFNLEENIKEEIKRLKKDINTNTKLKKYDIKNDKLVQKNNKVITVVGTNGVGKSIFCAVFSKYLNEIKKKTLIIDYDTNKTGIKEIFELNISPKEEIEIKDNLKFIFFNNMCDYNSKLLYEDIITYIKSVENIYDFIIIDTTTNLNEKNVLLNISDLVIFLIEPNIFEMKKAKHIEEIILYDWNINIEKMKIVFNKVNKSSIYDEILKEIYCNFEILGSINYTEKLNIFINKKTDYKLNNIEYEKIYRRIERSN